MFECTLTTYRQVKKQRDVRTELTIDTLLYFLSLYSRKERTIQHTDNDFLVNVCYCCNEGLKEMGVRGGGGGGGWR